MAGSPAGEPMPGIWLAPKHRTQHQHAGLAWASYFLLGTGMLAPWNAFITASDYYDAVYPGRHVDRLLTICYLPVCLLVIGLMVKWQGVLSQRFRILAAFGVFSAVMLCVPLMDALLVADAPEAPQSALALVLLAVVVVAICDGLCQGAIFGDASALPPQYTHAVVGGTASSGLVVSLLRVITKASMPSTRTGLRHSTALYFGSAAAISAACFGVYAAVMPQLDIIKHFRVHHGRRVTEDAGDRSCTELSRSNSDDAAFKAAAHQHATEADMAPLIPHHTTHSHQPSAHAPASHFVQQSCIQASTSNHGASPRSYSPSSDIPAHEPAAASRPTSPEAELLATHRHDPQLCWRTTAKRIWPLCAAIFCVYVVTLSIFPGFLAEDVHAAALGDWVGIIFITLWNFADLVGKTLPFWGKEPSHHAVLLAALARIVFLPLYFGALALEVHPIIMGVLTFMLGLTNGRLTARIMTRAPMGLVPPESELAENIVVFCMVAGLTVGAFCGFLWIL